VQRNSLYYRVAAKCILQQKMRGNFAQLSATIIDDDLDI